MKIIDPIIQKELISRLEIEELSTDENIIIELVKYLKKCKHIPVSDITFARLSSNIRDLAIEYGYLCLDKKRFECNATRFKCYCLTSRGEDILLAYANL